MKRQPWETEAEYLQRLRGVLGLTQAEAAELVGRSANHFAGYEQGRHPVPLFVPLLLEVEIARRQSRARSG